MAKKSQRISASTYAVVSILVVVSATSTLGETDRTDEGADVSGRGTVSQSA